MLCMLCAVSPVSRAVLQAEAQRLVQEETAQAKELERTIAAAEVLKGIQLAERVAKHAPSAAVAVQRQMTTCTAGHDPFSNNICYMVCKSSSSAVPKSLPLLTAG